MTDDPIVREVRQIRDRLAQKFNYNIEDFFKDACSRQKALGNKFVSPNKTPSNRDTTVNA